MPVQAKRSTRAVKDSPDMLSALLTGDEDQTFGVGSNAPRLHIANDTYRRMPQTVVVSLDMSRKLAFANASSVRTLPRPKCQ